MAQHRPVDEWEGFNVDLPPAHADYLGVLRDRWGLFNRDLAAERVLVAALDAMRAMERPVRPYERHHGDPKYRNLKNPYAPH